MSDLSPQDKAIIAENLKATIAADRFPFPSNQDVKGRAGEDRAAASTAAVKTAGAAEHVARQEARPTALMAIIDDYSAIAAELRRIHQAERPQPEKSVADRKTGVLVTGRGIVKVDIAPRPWRNHIVRRLLGTA